MSISCLVLSRPSPRPLTIVDGIVTHHFLCIISFRFQIKPGTPPVIFMSPLSRERTKPLMKCLLLHLLSPLPFRYFTLFLPLHLLILIPTFRSHFPLDPPPLPQLFSLHALAPYFSIKQGVLFSPLFSHDLNCPTLHPPPQGTAVRPLVSSDLIPPTFPATDPPASATRPPTLFFFLTGASFF